VFEINVSNAYDFDHIFSIFNFSKSMFSNRRKTIYNNLSSFLDDKELSLKILNDLDIPINKRPEELSPETFFKMYDHLKMY
jgi:16S rRNA (adenine1518-N6/adenine1519-N6)-dimethyltransferase